MFFYEVDIGVYCWIVFGLFDEWFEWVEWEYVFVGVEIGWYYYGCFVGVIGGEEVGWLLVDFMCFVDCLCVGVWCYWIDYEDVGFGVGEC